MLPRAPANYAQERRGISAVAAVAANLGQIWRETPTGDVGIDGQLEFVDASGFATGKTVAVQVKSGPSYVSRHDSRAYEFYPEEKHRAYWERYPLPVLLMLHDHEEGKTYWTDARQHLRDPQRSKKAAIPVPRVNVLQNTTAAQLFETAEVTGDVFIPDLEQVMMTMIRSRIEVVAFPVSYFDLFAQGLTLIARAVYYGLDLALTAARFNLSLRQFPNQEDPLEFDVSLGFDEHNFLFDYVKFLVSQGLANIDFADCLVDWVNREVHPHFVAPLSARGRQLKDLVGVREDSMVRSGLLDDGQYLRVCQEGFFEMKTVSYMARLPRIHRFQKIVLANETI